MEILKTESESSSFSAFVTCVLTACLSSEEVLARPVPLGQESPEDSSQQGQNEKLLSLVDCGLLRAGLSLLLYLQCPVHCLVHSRCSVSIG